MTAAHGGRLTLFDGSISNAGIANATLQASDWSSLPGRHRGHGTLVHRTRSGQDAQRIVKHPGHVELERVAFSQFGLAAMREA